MNQLRRTLLWLACWWLGGQLPPAQAQLGAEDRTLAAMWQRGLAETAIQVAQARLEHAADASHRAKWSMRLMECHAQAALRSPRDADPHWTAPEAILQQFASEHPDHARQPWLVWQIARCNLLNAQSQLAQVLAHPADKARRESTLNQVREVLKQAERLADDLERRLPRAARQGVQGRTEAPSDELHKLAVDIALLECDALLVRVKLYEPGSPDRVAAATEIDSRAMEVLARTAEDWTAKQQLQVAQAIAGLELGQSDKALRQLEVMAREASSPQVRVRAAVAAIEHLAGNAATSRAQPLLVYLTQASQSAGAQAELGLAQLQLTLADLGNQSEESKQQTLTALVNDAKQLGERFGEYWRNRAEALLVGSIPRDAPASSSVAMDLMLVEVRQLLASNDQAGAIERLLQFRDTAAASSRGELAIQLASQAAALLQRSQEWSSAIDALQTVVFEFSSVAGAAEAHRLLVWSRTQLLREEIGNAQLAKAYEDSLRQQLTLWPDAAASDEPQSWLTTWLVAQGRRADLLDDLRARAVATSRPEIARATMIHWLEQLLEITDPAERDAAIAALRKTSQESSSASSQQSMAVAGLFAEAVSNWPLHGQISDRRALVADLLRNIEDDVDRQLLVAVQLLDALRAGRIDHFASWKNDWQPRQLPVAIRVGLTAGLVEAIDELPLETQGQWLDALALDAEWIAELHARSSPLHKALGFRLQAWVENASVGLEGLASLAQQFPREGRLQLQLSHALAASGNNRLAESTRIASQVAASSAAGSELNLAARWRLCRNQLLAGETAAARAAAQLLLASQPMQDSVWQQRFESIANEAQR